MSELAVFAAYAVPVLIALLLAVAVVLLGFGVGRQPALLAFLFLLVMYWAPEISFGRVDSVLAPRSLYSRGAGVLWQPALAWAMVVSLIWLQVADRFATRPPLVPNLGPLRLWFLAFGLLYVLHVCVALLLDRSARDAVGPAGFSNVLWAGIFAALVCACFRTEASLKRLLWFIVLMGAAHAVYGLVRWAAFGGDPANAYANRHGLALRLTYFDVYDSLVSFLAAAASLLLLYPRRQEDAPVRGLGRFSLWCVIIVCTACIALSFRRAALFGLMLGGAFLFWQVSRAGRLRLLWLGAPAALAGVAYAAWRRLSQTKQAGGLSDFFFDVTPTPIGPDSPRLLELKLAWASFAESPLTGVGSWGNYKGWQLVSWQWYEGGGGHYLHSGVLHLGLKTGVVGLLLLLGLLVTYFVFWHGVRRQLGGTPLVLAACGVAGLLFVAPDFLISTSLTKLRAAMFIGLCIALPFAAAAVAGARPAERRAGASPGLGQLAPG
jgi:hypothetical protein